MADDLREDGDKLKSQLKDFVNFIPGKIVETSNRSWGTLIHAENYKDAPDNVIERKIWTMKAIIIVAFGYTGYLILQ